MLPSVTARFPFRARVFRARSCSRWVCKYAAICCDLEVGAPDRQHRLKAVLSRQQLADLSGVSARRIEQLEIGDDPGIQPETARMLASALGCPVNDLVEVVDGDE